jgi:hypothetical protein
MHAAPGVGVSVKIDDIVEVARSGALGESSEFFGECLDIIIGQHLNPFLRHVRIGMKDFCRDGW